MLQWVAFWLTVKNVCDRSLGGLGSLVVSVPNFWPLASVRVVEVPVPDPKL